MDSRIRHRLVPILFFIIPTAIGIACATDSPSSKKSAVQNTDYANERSFAERSLSVIANTKEREDPAAPYRPDCSDPHDERDANFCRQAQLVKSAEELNVFTQQQVDTAFSQLYWTRVEAFGLIVSLFITAIAAWSAAAAAKAAKDAIGTERAWITARRVDCGTATDATVDGVHYPRAYVFSVAWINSGRSPAVKSDIFTFHRTLGSSDQCPEFEPNWNSFDSGATIGPNLEVSGAVRAVVGKDYERFASGVAKVFIYSAVRYFDTFKKTMVRESEACFEVKLDGSLDAGGGRLIPRFSTRAVGAQCKAT